MNRCRQAFCLLLAAVFLAGLPAAGLAGTEDMTGPEADAASRMLREDELEALMAGGSLPITGEMEILTGDAEPQERTGRLSLRAGSSWSTEYYRDQLLEEEQIIYDLITGSELMNGPAAVTVEAAPSLPQTFLMIPRTIHADAAADGSLAVATEVDRTALQSVFQEVNAALLYDHPELSWLINTKAGLSYGYSDALTPEEQDALQKLSPGESCQFEGWVCLTSLAYGMSEESVRRATTAPEDSGEENPWEYADTKDRAAIEAQIAAAKAEIGSLAGVRPAAKVRAVHDWLCGHTDYADKSGERFRNGWRGYQTAWSALAERETVCAGYARALKLLLDEYSVPCVIVRGQSSGESHAWNYVRLDGRWYGVDATWADQAWGISDRDYLKGAAAFQENHTEESLAGGLAYPTLAADDYVEGAEPAALPGDVNLDGTVNLADIALLAEALEADSLNAAALENGDLDQSGRIDISDILLLTKLLREQGAGQGAAAGSTAAVRVEGPASVQPGEEICVTVSGTGQAVSGRLTAAGLEFAGVSGSMADAGAFVLLPDYGAPSVSYTFRVTAVDGKVSVRAGNCCTADALSAYRAADASWSAPVADGRAALMDAIDALRSMLNDQFEKTIWESSDGKDVAPAALWVPVGTRDRLMNDVLKPALRVAESDDATGAEMAEAAQSAAAAVAGTASAAKRGGAESDVLVTASGPLTAGSTAEITVTLAKGSGYAGFTATIRTSGLAYQSNTGIPLSTEREARLISTVSPSVTYKYLVNAPAGQVVQFELTDGVLDTGEETAAYAEPSKWSAAVAAEGSSVITTPDVPQPVPAPAIAAVDGYQGGRANGMSYYATTSGASMLFYQTKPSGGMTRVIAPTVKDKTGRQYCPANLNGTVLFPRVTKGALTAYCEYRDGQEIPVLAVRSLPPAAGADMQTLSLNGKTYHVRLSGSSMLFYQPKPSGGLTRVIAPYASDRNGSRYYPINCGGTVLIPKLQRGMLQGYAAAGSDRSDLVLVPISSGLHGGQKGDTQ